MPLANELISQLQQSFIQELHPTPARKVAEIPTNQFGQPRFGEGNLIVAYGASGTPLTMKVSGLDEDLAILQSPFIDHVRMIECGDAGTAQKLADLFEALFGSTIALDEPNRRRIRRAAAPRNGAGDLPPGMVRDRRTGEIRERMRPGRRPTGEI